MSFEDLMEDASFVSKLYDAQDMAAVKAIFAEAGLEITEEELMRHILPNGEELKEQELEDVSGGASWFNPFISWLRGGGKGAAGGGGKMGGR